MVPATRCSLPGYDFLLLCVTGVPSFPQYTRLFLCQENGILYFWDSANNIYHYHSKPEPDNVAEENGADGEQGVEEEEEEEGELNENEAETNG